MSAFKDLLQRLALLTVSLSLSVSSVLLFPFSECVCLCAPLCVHVHLGVTANSVHPGVVLTEVMRHYSFMVRLLFNLIGFFFFKVSIFYCRVTVHIISPLLCHQLCNRQGQVCLAAVEEPPPVILMHSPSYLGLQSKLSDRFGTHHTDQWDRCQVSEEARAKREQRLKSATIAPWQT